MAKENADPFSTSSEVAKSGAAFASAKGIGQALGASEFERGIVLANRVADLKERIRVLDHPLMMEQPRLMQQMKNANFYLEEATQELARIATISTPAEQALLKSAVLGGGVAKPLTIAPARTIKTLGSSLLRGASKFAGPAVALYEAGRGVKNVLDHGVLPGLAKTGGTIVGETGDVLKAAGGLYPQPRKESPSSSFYNDPWGEKAEFENALSNPALSAFSSALSGVGDLMGSARSWGPSGEEPLQISAERFETLMDSDSPQPSVKKKSNRWPYDR